MIGQYLDLARAHAPLLLFVAPLVGAALVVASPSVRLSWAIAAFAATLTGAIAIDSAWRVLLAHALGSPAQEGIALYLDGIGAFTAACVCGAGALSAIAAGAFIRSEVSGRAAPFGLALLLCVIAGWNGALMARDFVGLFVATETAWLAGLGLVALSAGDRGALTGALRMLNHGGAAAAVMLLGVGFIARGVGSADLLALANSQLASPELTGAGVALMLIALALKAGIAPLHLWTGAAYGRAGAVAAMAIGVLGAIGALAVLVRVAAFALLAPAIGDGISSALLMLGLLSVVVGSVQAVGARNLRRLVAYAGTAQAGCVLISVALGSPAGLASALVQLLAQGAAALALLAGAAGLGGAHTLSTLDGAARRAPLSSAAITVGALSLMGAPLTLGFLGRWRLIEAGVGGGWWWATGAVIVASLAAVFYGGRLIERLYFRRASTPADEAPSAWRFALAPALVAAIAAIAMGFEPSLLLRAADAASVALDAAP